MAGFCDVRPPESAKRLSASGLRLVLVAAFGLGLTGCATSKVPRDLGTVRSEVMAAERAFAQTMAERDLKGFAEFVSEEAVFFGSSGALRGRAQVVAGWASYFASAEAPFSWAPDVVEPLASGTLAHSSGPVRNSEGKLVARFNSIWRLEAPGVWRVIFDKGSPLPPDEAGQ